VGVAENNKVYKCLLCSLQLLLPNCVHTSPAPNTGHGNCISMAKDSSLFSGLMSSLATSPLLNESV